MVEGELRPGDRVRQEEIAERLGVSLAPVREALAVLEQEGQVTYLPRRGYTVAELALDEVREIYALRALLEERAARRALPLLDEDAVGRIELAARANAPTPPRPATSPPSSRPTAASTSPSSPRPTRSTRCA